MNRPDNEPGPYAHARLSGRFTPLPTPHRGVPLPCGREPGRASIQAVTVFAVEPAWSSIIVKWLPGTSATVSAPSQDACHSSAASSPACSTLTGGSLERTSSTGQDSRSGAHAPTTWMYQLIAVSRSESMCANRDSRSNIPPIISPANRVKGESSRGR